MHPYRVPLSLTAGAAFELWLLRSKDAVFPDDPDRWIGVFFASLLSALAVTTFIKALWREKE